MDTKTLDTKMLETTVESLWGIAQRHITHTWRVRLDFPPGMAIFGGMSASAESNRRRPWRERREELRSAADATTEAAVEETTALYTVFRRDPDTGGLALSANQLRTWLNEACRSSYPAAESMLLQRGIRSNLWIQPTLLVLRRPPEGSVILEPEGIDYLPRPINRPPFARSIVAQPEYVIGPVVVRFTIQGSRTAAPSARAICDEAVLRHLLEYASVFCGIGSHRGLDHGRCAVTVESIEIHDVALPPSLAGYRSRST